MEAIIPQKKATQRRHSHRVSVKVELDSAREGKFFAHDSGFIEWVSKTPNLCISRLIILFFETKRRKRLSRPNARHRISANQNQLI